MEPGIVSPQEFSAFGSPATEKLDEWLHREGLQAKLDRWFEDGGSGAKVAVVVLSACHKKWHAKLVLKLCPAGERTKDEVANSKRSWDEASPEFRTHLAEPWAHFEVGDTGALFLVQKLAAKAIGYSQSLFEIPKSQIADAYGVIVTSLMNDWIVGDSLVSHSVSEFLSLQLAGREVLGGPVRDWVADHADLSRSLLDNETYSDPLALLDELGEGAHMIDYVFHGSAHGDLHPANVLVPVRPKPRPADYMLIDLARFGHDSVLSRDPAFLMLCLVHYHFVRPVAANHPHRNSLIELLANPFSSVGTSAPDEAHDLVTRFRDLVTPGPEQSDGFDDHWQEQKMLSTVACALMFLCRPNIPDIDREWFYRLAARMARTGAEIWGEEDRENDTAHLPHAIDRSPSVRIPSSTEQIDFRGNLRFGNFPLANPWGEIALLTEALDANATQLIGDIEAAFLGSTPEEVDAYATAARLTINEVAKTLDQLDEEEIDEVVGMGSAFDFTEGLGRAGEELDRVRQALEKISVNGYHDGLARSLRNAAGALQAVAKSLQTLTHP